MIRTFHHIQFEANSKRLFFMQGMFSIHCVYFMDKLLLLIAAVSINSYYLLVSIIIALRAGVCSFSFDSMFIVALILGTSPSVFSRWRYNDEADTVNGKCKMIL